MLVGVLTQRDKTGGNKLLICCPGAVTSWSPVTSLIYCHDAVVFVFSLGSVCFLVSFALFPTSMFLSPHRHCITFISHGLFPMAWFFCVFLCPCAAHQTDIPSTPILLLCCWPLPVHSLIQACSFLALLFPSPISTTYVSLPHSTCTSVPWYFIL